MYGIHYNTGTIVEGPRNITYLPSQALLPIELTCNVTEGVVAWRVNGTQYTLGELSAGVLPEHNSTGTNILVNSPINNTQYICVSNTSMSSTQSDPAYFIFSGECSYIYICYTLTINLVMRRDSSYYTYM